MRLLSICSAVLLLGGSCFAQQWELGAAAGYGMYTKKPLTQGSGSADASFKDSLAVRAFAVQNMYRHISGEFGYTLQFDSLKLTSGGTEASFSGRSHAIHYDLLFLACAPSARIRPYVLGGGGIKVYQGTGAEHATQPLGNFAALTHTQEVKGLITFGGGIRAKISSHAFFYIEARDYMSQFPTKVITPIPPAKISGWIHDLTPMIGLSFGF